MVLLQQLIEKALEGQDVVRLSFSYSYQEACDLNAFVRLRYGKKCYFCRSLRYATFYILFLASLFLGVVLSRNDVAYPFLVGPGSTIILFILMNKSLKEVSFYYCLSFLLKKTIFSFEEKEFNYYISIESVFATNGEVAVGNEISEFEFLKYKDLLILTNKNRTYAVPVRLDTEGKISERLSVKR